MSNDLKMPSDEELSALSNDDLNRCILMAFNEWNEIIRRGENTAEVAQVFRAYDSERLKRMRRFSDGLE